jgi:Domain of unknown function (DUF4303)
MFDVDNLVDFALIEIKKFAEEHKDETFYAFSIDADMLCLNSEEKFQKTLASYKEKYPKSYNSQEKIDDLKYNTGDWGYQGFATLTDETGFDKKAYDKHYYLSREKQKTSKYGLAMDKLIEVLVKRKAFDCLKKTDNFIANRVEHNY